MGFVSTNLNTTDINQISTLIKAPVKKVSKALDVLLRRKFLIVDNFGKLKLNSDVIETTDNITNESLRSRHKENLLNAMDSLVNDPIPSRDFFFQTIAINSKQIEAAQSLIRKFHDDLADVLAQGEKDAVYEFCTQLFPRSLVNNKNNNIKNEIKENKELYQLEHPENQKVIH